MPDLLKLISFVQKVPALYEKGLFSDYDMHDDLWDRIAMKSGIISGYEANKLWKDLIKDYIEYLRDGKVFEFGNEMVFLQAHLISLPSDSDELEDDELEEIIDSESETSASNPPSNHQPTKTKRKRLRTTRSNNTNRMEKAQKNATADSSTAFDSSSVASTNVAGFSSLQLIFLGYAKILQDLPLPVQIKTKHKIAQIMNEAEMSLLEIHEGSDVSNNGK